MPTAFETHMAGLGLDLWARLDDVSGTIPTDSSSNHRVDGLYDGATFGRPTVTIDGLPSVATNGLRAAVQWPNVAWNQRSAGFSAGVKFRIDPSIEGGSTTYSIWSKATSASTAWNLCYRPSTQELRWIAANNGTDIDQSVALTPGQINGYGAHSMSINVVISGGVITVKGFFNGVLMGTWVGTATAMAASSAFLATSQSYAGVGAKGAFIGDVGEVFYGPPISDAAHIAYHALAAPTTDPTPPTPADNPFDTTPWISAVAAALTGKKWNREKVRVSGSYDVRWDVRERLAASSAVTWAVRERIDGSSAATWDVRERIDGDSDVTWDVETLGTVRVDGEHDVAWDVRARVDGESDVEWDVRERLAGETEVEWDVRRRVDGTSLVAWDVRERVDGSSAVVWDVRERTDGSSAVAWDLRERRGGEYGLTWDVHARIAGAHDLVTWAVRERRDGSRAAAWDVRERLGSGSDVRWDARARLGGSQEATWDVLVRLGGAYAVLYDVQQRRAGSQGATWDVRRRVSSSELIYWNTFEAQQRVHGSLDVLWGLRARVDGDVDVLYDTGARVRGARLVTWDVRDRLAGAGEVRWDQGGRANGSASVTWSVRGRVDGGQLLTWSVRERRAVGSDVRWDVFVYQIWIADEGWVNVRIRSLYLNAEEGEVPVRIAGVKDGPLGSGVIVGVKDRQH